MKARTTLGNLLFAATCLLFPQHALSAVDTAAAQALAKKEGCLKCHAKGKDAKPLSEVASKFKVKPDAQAAILKQITTGASVKLDDGTEEEHKIIKTKDTAAINNMIGWILSLAK